MKKKQDIYFEVKEILKRRGFDVGWASGIRCAIERGRLLWWDPSRSCNWIIK